MKFKAALHVVTAAQNSQLLANILILLPVQLRHNQMHFHNSMILVRTWFACFPLCSKIRNIKIRKRNKIVFDALSKYTCCNNPPVIVMSHACADMGGLVRDTSCLRK